MAGIRASRIANSAKDFDRITALYDSPLQMRSAFVQALLAPIPKTIFGDDPSFRKMGRIGCLHVRNLKHLGSDRVFRESSHFSSDGDLDMYEIMLAVYELSRYLYPPRSRKNDLGKLDVPDTGSMTGHSARAI